MKPPADLRRRTSAAAKPASRRPARLFQLQEVRLHCVESRRWPPATEDCRRSITQRTGDSQPMVDRSAEHVPHRSQDGSAPLRLEPTSRIQSAPPGRSAPAPPRAARTGTPRFVACAIAPPATVPDQHPAPWAIWPRAKAASSVPGTGCLEPVHQPRLVAPEKKVKAQPQQHRREPPGPRTGRHPPHRQVEERRPKSVAAPSR